MQRTILHVSEILAWADEHRRRTGKFPTVSAGTVRGRPGEKWANINQALRQGLRGLSRGGSLARLLANRRGARNSANLPTHSLTKILHWADAHRRRTGHWPTLHSGAVFAGPGETWVAVDAALRIGLRGLPGGSSLAKLLAKSRGVINRAANPLSITRILHWADLHKKRTGSWPTKTSGMIAESPTETWSAVSEALRRGARGLPGGSSLAMLLAKSRGVRREIANPLSIPQILRWADSHQQQTGDWPRGVSGKILDSPTETWSRVSQALQQGSRGLPGGSSLAKLLAKSRGVLGPSATRFSVSRILRWADSHKKRTGNWPTCEMGQIADSPNDTWVAVNRALSRGLRGLPGGSSLFRLLAKRRGMRWHMRQPPLSVQRILEWADAHKQRTGWWPNNRSTEIPEAPAETWGRIRLALYRGGRGLPTGLSLARLLAQHRGYRDPHSLPDYTVAKILRWADSHKRRTGSWPSRNSGAVHDAPGETWTAVNVALDHGNRGLPSGSSLPRLLAKHRGVRNLGAISKLTIAGILRWADMHKKRTGNWPIVAGGRITDAKGETWTAIDHALRRGTRGLLGGSSLFGLLSERRGVRPHVRHPPLSMPQILRWADAYKRRSGRWPNVHSGSIPEAPGENWERVQVALYQGKRGLPNGLSIAKLLAKHRGFRNIQDLPQMTERLMVTWIRAYYRRHGRMPKHNSGVIPGTNGENWRKVENALRFGLRGMPSGSSLAKLIRKRFPREAEKVSKNR